MIQRTIQQIQDMHHTIQQIQHGQQITRHTVLTLMRHTIQHTIRPIIEVQFIQQMLQIHQVDLVMTNHQYPYPLMQVHP